MRCYQAEENSRREETLMKKIFQDVNLPTAHKRSGPSIILTHPKGKQRPHTKNIVPPRSHPPSPTDPNHTPTAACPSLLALHKACPRQAAGRDAKSYPCPPFGSAISLLIGQDRVPIETQTDMKFYPLTPPPTMYGGTTKMRGGNAADHWGTLQSWPVGHSCTWGKR